MKPEVAQLRSSNGTKVVGQAVTYFGMPWKGLVGLQYGFSTAGLPDIEQSIFFRLLVVFQGGRLEIYPNMQRFGR